MRPFCILSFLLAFFCITPVFAQNPTMIVLDGSGSMWGQINGTTKIETARDALRDVLGTIPMEIQLGMLVYGHREEGNCADIELAVPVGQSTAERITSFADRINPKGKTPLSNAVRQAAEELNYRTAASTVVLITDGIETCHANPCAVARELEEHGTDLTVHVIGFGLSDDEGKQVACLAEHTGGRYLSAADALQLSEALAKTVAQEPEAIDVENNLICLARLAEGTAPMAGNKSVQWDFFSIGEEGNPSNRSEAQINDGVCETRLLPGRYLARARLGNIVKQRRIVLTGDKATEVEARFDAGLVTVTAKQSARATQLVENARVQLISKDGMTSGEGSISTFASAGPVTAIGRTGRATSVENRELAAGEEIEIGLILGSGAILPSAVYAKDRPAAENDRVRYNLIEAEPNANREPAVIPLGDTPSLDGVEVPAGRYLLRARLGQAEGTTPVVVEAGKPTQATVDLNAGVLHVKALGAYRIEFFEALTGGRAFGGAYGEEAREFFNAGAYQVRVAYDRGAVEKHLIATVEAGIRTEVEVDTYRSRSEYTRAPRIRAPVLASRPGREPQPPAATSTVALKVPSGLSGSHPHPISPYRSSNASPRSRHLRLRRRSR